MIIYDFTHHLLSTQVPRSWQRLLLRGRAVHARGKCCTRWLAVTELVVGVVIQLFEKHNDNFGGIKTNSATAQVHEELHTYCCSVCSLLSLLTLPAVHLAH